MIRVVHPGSRIRMLTFYPSRIPDPGVKKTPDPGSATLALKIGKLQDLPKKKKKKTFPHRKGGRAAGRAPGPESWCPGGRRRWDGCCCCRCPPPSRARGSGPGRRRFSRRCGALCRHLCCCSSGIHPPGAYAFRSSATLLWHGAGIFRVKKFLRSEMFSKVYINYVQHAMIKVWLGPMHTVARDWWAQINHFI
jgi:hypothetical protein